jgi:hypothetical protein
MVTLLGKKSIYQTILFYSSKVDPINLMVNLKIIEDEMRKMIHPNRQLLRLLVRKLTNFFSSRSLIPSQVIKGSVCELYLTKKTNTRNHFFNYLCIRNGKISTIFQRTLSLIIYTIFFVSNE